MNASKTKIMSNYRKVPINVDEKQIEYVNSYIYLGKQVSFIKNNNEEEIERRINLSWKKFWSLKEILKGSYSLNLKKTVMDTCILPCLTYGCQTWVFTETIKEKNQKCQHAMERSLLKIRKIQRIKSVDIRNQTKVIDALEHSLKMKWQWAGHVSRYIDHRWTIRTTKWPGPSGKRSVGRPKKRWADDIISTAGKQWMQVALNRETWKELEEAFTQQGSIPPTTNT